MISLELLTLTHGSLADKLAKYGLDTQIVRCIENCQRCWAQRLVNRCVKPTLNRLIGGVLRVNAESILLKNSINNEEDETECTQGNFIDNTELGGLANTPDGFAVIQRGLDRLVEKKFMKFNKGKKIFLLGRNLSIHQHILGEKRMKTYFPGKDMGFLEDTKLTMSE